MAQPDTPLTRQQRDQVDRLASQFEMEFRRGQRPEIEDFVRRMPEHRRHLLEELLKVELKLRQGVNESPVVSEYRNRFPNDEDLIIAALSTQATKTVDQPTKHGSDKQDVKEPDFERIGRYQVVRRLGGGGFGIVYLARDSQLDRLVAIKTPRTQFETVKHLAAFLDEARKAAKLKHPGLVTVYDVQQGDGVPYIVQEYIDGQNLGQWARKRRPGLVQLAEVFITIADALGYAHERGLTHCDLKFANVLIDGEDKPHVADFGLAVEEIEQSDRIGARFGTPPMMAPEQVRGEGHRLDGRTDIWALGVMLYELLTGRRPFGATDEGLLFDQILSLDPRPPRQINRRVPHEVNRICLKCLSRRRTDRYSSAEDLRDDLHAWFTKNDSETATTSSAVSKSSPTILPKGLRSFDEHDADFFLELLPGPRDRYGLPDSIRFWKSAIEKTNPASTFSVGLIYGPSGCGKSSFVKAGLLPRLASHVNCLYLEATPVGMESRLQRVLSETFPVVTGHSLRESVSQLRAHSRPGRKLLIVIDQFEQWLHARGNDESTELADALRHCDGDQVQCLLLVRDDFWMAATRFMSDLELPLVEGHNTGAVDLFPRRHAQQVLTLFGRAFGALPESDELSSDQSDFVNNAIDGLSQAGKVSCVRLALFADMMREVPWTMKNLKQVGGVEGVGVAFLEEKFASTNSPRRCRFHQQAARNVLETLLPDPSDEIRGSLRSYVELREASGYAQQGSFDDLLQILDGEARLITPSVSDAVVEVGADAERSGHEKYFQLTHDYLVPSIREWLTLKNRETRRGRAQLQLDDRTGYWNARREAKQLPSFIETWTIWRLTDRSRWSGEQSQMMHAAIRLHSARILSSLAIAVLLGAVGLVIWNRAELARQENDASQFVAQVLVADLANLSQLASTTTVERERWHDRLRSIAMDPTRGEAERLRANLMVIDSQPESIGYLIERLRTAEVREAIVIRDAFQPRSAEAVARLWDAATPDSSDAELLRFAACLARYDSESERFTAIADRVAGTLVATNPFEVGDWTRALQPAARWLIAPLDVRFGDVNLSQPKRVVTAGLLARFAADSPSQLSCWIVDADAEQFPLLFTALGADTDEAIAQLNHQLAQLDRDQGGLLVIDKKTRCIIALILLSHDEKVWSSLRQTSHPELRTSLISSMKRFAVAPQTLSKQLGASHPSSVRSALLLALGEYDAEPTEEWFESIVEGVTKIYVDDSDGGVHAAAEWLLRRWGQELPNIVPKNWKESGASKVWWENTEGQLLLPQRSDDEFFIGSPEKEAGRDPIETRRKVTLKHPFAISAHEITIAQYLRFDPAADYARIQAGSSPISRFRVDERSAPPIANFPINRVTWYDAVRYCRWLSEKDGVPEDQMCYPPLEEIGPGMKLPEDLLERTGYRLPTEMEWEYAARAGSDSRWCFGDDQTYLADFGWYVMNSQELTWPVGSLRPNAFGLSDTYGNVNEWCSDLSSVPGSNETASALASGADVRAGERMFRGGCYIYWSRLVRSAKRFSFSPNTRFSNTGFRIARTLRD